MLGKKQFREWAKANHLIILAFKTESNSGNIIGVAVETRYSDKEQPLYTFGRIYHVFADDFVYDQCGCQSFTNPEEVRLCAYRFFGII